MRAKPLISAVSLLLFLFLSFLGSTVHAQEVIYFNNGTYMKIVAHDVQGSMIKVALDTGSMAFPAGLVDKIESASGVVWGGPASNVFPNQMAPGAFVPQSTAVVGTRSPSARERDADTIARQANAGRSQVPAALSGRKAESAFPDGSIAAGMVPVPGGMMQVGNHLVLGTNVAGQGTPFRPSRFGLKAGAGSRGGANPQQQQPVEQPPSQQPQSDPTDDPQPNE